MNPNLTDSILEMMISLLGILRQDEYKLLDFEIEILNRGFLIYM